MRGVRGLRGQRLGGRALSGETDTILQVLDLRSGSGTLSLPRACWVHAFIWGGGGSGAAASSTEAGGGGGGGACFARELVLPGHEIFYSVGDGGLGVAPHSGGLSGQETILSFPRRSLRAGGGAGGSGDGGLGGTAFGGDLNRRGGLGGNGSGGLPGEAGEFGFPGGSGSGLTGGGGGAGGYSDQPLFLVGGADASAATGRGSGGRSGGPSSANGESGRVLIVCISA